MNHNMYALGGDLLERRDIIRPVAQKLVRKWGKRTRTKIGRNVLLGGDGQQIRGPTIDNYYRGRSDAAVIGAIFSGAGTPGKIKQKFPFVTKAQK